MSCGVTVVMDVMKVMARKAGNDRVTHKPILAASVCLYLSLSKVLVIPKCCSEPDKPEDKRPPLHQVAKRTK